MTVPHVDLDALGLRIRDARRLTNLSQARFAVEIGANERTYRRAECGDRAPKLALLTAIAARCGVRLEWLATGQGEPRPPDVA
jgi:transcriptional regulator with XRE-family HTH domain